MRATPDANAQAWVYENRAIAVCYYHKLRFEKTQEKQFLDNNNITNKSIKPAEVSPNIEARVAGNI